MSLKIVFEAVCQRDIFGKRPVPIMEAVCPAPLVVLSSARRFCRIAFPVDWRIVWSDAGSS